MPVRPAPTPNPSAMKFSVGKPVGGPATFVKGADTDNDIAKEILAIEGVASMFMTADFVTITKSPQGSWETITPQAVKSLEAYFGS